MLISLAPFAEAQTYYVQQNLTADIQGQAANVDPNLVNPWGLAYAPTGPFWISNGGTGTSTIYDEQGRALPQGQPLVVKIPLPILGPGHAEPTGVAFNPSIGFQIAPAKPAIFLFATSEGAIAAWNPEVVREQAVVVLDRSSFGASYKGLTVGDDGGTIRLYAANFTGNAVDVFDSNFTKVTLAGNFTDPSLPEGYSPFNVQVIDGHLFVAYAKRNGDEEEVGVGKGFINDFSIDGIWLRRFATNMVLNAPWAMLKAPPSFGALAGTILVGNFGDGKIHAYDKDTGSFRGALEKSPGQPIQIPGLWGLIFGSGAGAGDTDKLYFTAGPDDETHGLFGVIRVAQPGEQTTSPF